MKGDPRLRPAAFRPGTRLPEKLPDGAHRVISELTSAKMRSMMAGTVIEGSGKAATLNGYSSGGKTGTAQKIDPATHTYSHTKLVASFAGIAPVSNPAIAIAVVIDTPTLGTRYGSTTSAPVFAEVAQQVLEYLGVPHDQPLHARSKSEIASTQKPSGEDDAPSDSGADLGALFAEVNSLPADDPLRAKNDAAMVAASPAPAPTASAPIKKGMFGALPDKILTAFREHGGSSVMPDSDDQKPLPKSVAQTVTRPDGGVVVSSEKNVPVPTFVGASMRLVVERARGVGLRVQPVGSGIATEQVPAAGAMVPQGTEVIVRFAR